MATNDEIIQGCEHDGSYIPVREVRRLMDKARADTAKQIFDVINTSPIFYEFHCNKCKEYLIFECKHYQALKRKYKVD